MIKFVYLLLLVLLCTTLAALDIDQSHYGFTPGAQRDYRQGAWNQNTTDLSEGNGKSWNFSLPQTGYVHNSYYSTNALPDYPGANIRCAYTQYINGIDDAGTTYLQNDGIDIITLGYTGYPNVVWNQGIPHGLPHTINKTWQGTHAWLYGSYTVSGKVISEGSISIPLGSFPALCIRYHYETTNFDYYYYQWETTEYGIVAYANTLNGGMLYVLEDAEPNGSALDEELACAVPELCLYPNPMLNTSPVAGLSIEFSMAKKPAGQPVIRIYNLKGQKVKTIVLTDECSLGNKSGLRSDPKQNGIFYSTLWNGRDDNDRKLTSGTYIAKVMADKEVTTAKFTIVK